MNTIQRARSYCYHVRWSPHDQAFIATVAEFPGLECADLEAAKAAIDGLAGEVARTLEAMASNGRPPPNALVSSGSH